LAKKVLSPVLPIGIAQTVSLVKFAVSYHPINILFGLVGVPKVIVALAAV
jgi:hypothetical protein